MYPFDSPFILSKKRYLLYDSRLKVVSRSGLPEIHSQPYRPVEPCNADKPGEAGRKAGRRSGKQNPPGGSVGLSISSVLGFPWDFSFFRILSSLSE
jgi:hypothetical protein